MGFKLCCSYVSLDWFLPALLGGFKLFCRYVVWTGFFEPCYGTLNFVVDTLFSLVYVSHVMFVVVVGT